MYFEIMSLSGKTLAILDTIINSEDCDELKSDFDVLIQQDLKIRNYLSKELNIDLDLSFFKYYDELKDRLKELRYLLICFLNKEININKINLEELKNLEKIKINLSKEKIPSEETLKLYNSFKKEELNCYFNNVLENRVGLKDELKILLSVLKENYLFENDVIVLFENNTIEPSNEDLYDFLVNNKRPFGNKNIKQSIAYNLNWDKERRLTIFGNSLPKNVENECEILFNELKNYLKN